MPIPNDMLQEWSKKGSNKISNPAHTKIRMALGNPQHSILKQKNMDFTTMLQGSYINDTSIEGNSDVDLVVHLKLFKSNVHLLSQTKQQELKKQAETVYYPFSEYRNDVYKTLVSYFQPEKVLKDSKSIKVNIEGDYWADVVPALRYIRFDVSKEDINLSKDFVRGIYLETEEGERIINFPNQHQANGHNKNKETNQVFKDMVRIFKNARTYLVQENVLLKKTAPSYFIENLIYNVPNKLFCEDYQSTFKKIIDFLDQANIGDFPCQNEQDKIFGLKPWQWNETDAKDFIRNMKELWERW